MAAGGLAGSLWIQMGMDLARLSDDMAKSKGIVGGAMRDIENAVSSAKSVLTSLGVGLGIGYFVTLIKGSIDASAHLEDLNKSTRISIEDLAGLSVLAKRSGGDIDSMALSINRLTVNMGKNPEAFRALGISAKDPLEAFKQLSDIFLKLQDPEQRAAVMAQALGKAWFGAAPALAMGGEKIGEMIEKGKRLSGVTEETAQQAKLLHDKWVDLVGSGGLLTRLIAPMLPLLNLLADSMLNASEKADGLRASFSPLAEFLKVLVVMGANVSFVFDTLGKDIARMVENVQLIAKGDFAGSRALGEMFRKDAEAARVALDAYIDAIMRSGLTGKPAPAASGPKPDAATAAAAAKFLDPAAHKGLWDDYIKGLKEVVAVQEQAEKAQTDFNEANSKTLQDAQFQISLIGKTSEEIEKLTAIRNIDLAAKAAEAKVNSELSPDQFRAIVEEAKASTKTTLDMIAARREAERSWITGTKTAFNEYIDHARNAAEQASFFFTNAFRNMENALVEFARTGKLDFRSFADSVIADLIRIQVRQALAGFAGSSLGVLLGLGGASGGIDPNTFAGHTGGTVGLDIMRTSLPMHPALLSAVPRFHRGLAPDERLGIFQTGERIIPRGGGGGEPVFHQVFNIGSNVTKADLAAVADAGRRGAMAAIAEERRRDPAGPFGG